VPTASRSSGACGYGWEGRILATVRPGVLGFRRVAPTLREAPQAVGDPDPTEAFDRLSGRRQSPGISRLHLNVLKLKLVGEVGCSSLPVACWS
jgi:hypothetical protein